MTHLKFKLITFSSIFLLSTASVSSHTGHSHILAQATPSSTTIQDSVKQKVAEELAQIKQNVAKKGFAGTITAKSDATLTLNTLLNEQRTVTVLADSVIKLASNKDGTPNDLKVGDLVLVMGSVDSQNTMTAKRLLVVSKPTEDRRLTLAGTVSALSSGTLTVTPFSSGKSPQNIKLNSDTKYTKKSKLSDLKIGTKIVIITTSSGGFSTPTAKTIHILGISQSPTPTAKPAN